MRLGKMRVQKIKQLTEALAFPQLRHRAAQLLRLRSIPVRGNDKPPRHAVGGFHPEIPTHDVQTEIDPRRAACGSQDLAFVLVEHILDHVDVRVAGFKRLNVAPVRRGFASVEQTGGGQHKYTRADGE